MPATSAATMRAPQSRAAARQRREQGPGIDLGLLGGAESGRRPPVASPGSSFRHSLPSSCSASQRMTPVQLGAAPKLGRLVAIERDVQRAAAPVGHRQPASPAPARGRRRATRAAEASAAPSRRSSPQLASPTGAIIPAATLGGGGPGRASRRREPRRPRAPPARRRSARRAHRRPRAARSRRARSASSTCRLLLVHRLPPRAAAAGTSLRRHHPDQVRTVGGLSRPLSP